MSDKMVDSQTAAAEDNRGPRFFLGPRATALALDQAGADKVTKQHLEDAIVALEARAEQPISVADGGHFSALAAQLRDGQSEILTAIAAAETAAESRSQRLLNGINGIRYMFEMYAVQLSGGDLQEAVHDVNDLIDGLSKPIQVSKSEVEHRRQAERQNGSRTAAEAEQLEQVMQAVDGGAVSEDESSFAERDAEEELER